jgi:hypothetical protein
MGQQLASSFADLKAIGARGNGKSAFQQASACKAL